jgi:hypothetical protein
LPAGYHHPAADRAKDTSTQRLQRSIPLYSPPLTDASVTTPPKSLPPGAGMLWDGSGFIRASAKPGAKYFRIETTQLTFF